MALGGVFNTQRSTNMSRRDPRSKYRQRGRTTHTSRGVTSPSKYGVATGSHWQAGGGYRTYGYRQVAQRNAINPFIVNKLKSQSTAQRSQDSRAVKGMTVSNPIMGTKEKLGPETLTARRTPFKSSSSRKRTGARLRNMATANRGGILG